MKLIVLRLPQATSRNDLLALVKKVLSHKFHIPFTDNPVITSCEVYEYRDKSGVVDYHGIISIHPDEAGQWLIRHFKNQHLHHKLVFIKEFHERRLKKQLDADSDHRHEGVEIDLKSSGIHVDYEALNQYKRTYKG